MVCLASPVKSMGCFGYLCEIGSSSSSRSRTNASPVRTVGTDMQLYSENLTSYASACQEDSNLRSSDYMLYQRTTRVINSLAAQTENQSLSLDSLMEVYGFVLELNQDAVRVIIKSKEDVWKNKDLRSLIDVYFKSTAKTLDFFRTIENCVKRAKTMQLIIRFAAKQFETESVNTELEGNNKKKYVKTLEELNKFKAVGDPFGDEFMTQYESVYEQHVVLLDKYRNLIVKLEKRQRNVKIWMTLSNVVFRTLFLSTLVLSVVLAAMNVVPVVSAVASALTTPFESVGKWFSEMWEAYENAVGRQRGLAISLENRTRINNVATMTIRDLLEKLRTRVSLILETVEFAVERKEDEIATRLAMQEIMKKVEEFTEKIEVFGENMANSSKFIVSGQLQVLKHIVRIQPKNRNFCWWWFWQQK